MVNSKELMIGAWVKSKKDLAKVTALYKENDGIHVEGNVVSLIPNGLEPIPLTAVLLEKNGWQKDGSEPNTYVHPKLGANNRIIIKDVPVIHDFEVPYVHLLQNVLTLLDENITIDMLIFHNL